MKYRDEIAPFWEDLGIQLFQEEYIHKLKIIKIDHPGDTASCCRRMFDLWLSVDIEASWNKLIDALKVIRQNTLAVKLMQDVLKGTLIVSYICI